MERIEFVYSSAPERESDENRLGGDDKKKLFIFGSIDSRSQIHWTLFTSALLFRAATHPDSK